MILSRYNLKKITTPDLVPPGDDIFELPEKVLQFGTGALLRGLPDYYIDKANREGIFNGRIVVVKTTNVGLASDFERQDGLYTLHVKGVDNGQEINQQHICSAISRVLFAGHDWASILKIAHNPQLKVVISNTTEIGIILLQDNVKKYPPVSFPGKLLAILYERYKAFEGSEKSGLVIIATELIAENGKKLESIVLELAHLNRLDPAFMDWLENYNHFCNSMVDRIVPGKPNNDIAAELDRQTGYHDELRIEAEVYNLWAIEGNDEIKDVLSFAEANPGVIIQPDIGVFRELKLRLLNGTHTLSCAIAMLSGFKTVNEAMENSVFLQFVSGLMLNEIVPAIPYDVDESDAVNFADRVIDRFKNPNIAHQWISIAFHYTAKVKFRVVPMLIHHYKKSDTVPERIACGFAAFIRFMRVAQHSNDRYAAEINGVEYLLNDGYAEKFYNAWLNNSIEAVVETILKDTTIWDTDLTRLNGFKESVISKLDAIMQGDTLSLLAELDLIKSKR